MRKWIPVMCLLVISVVVFISSMIETNKNIKIISRYKNYNITSIVGEADYIEIEILINNSKSYFVDKKQVVSSELLNYQETDSVKLSLIDIVNQNEKINYEKEDFYRYVFVFKVEFVSETKNVWYFNEAFLSIVFNNDLNYKIKIGCVSLIKLETLENDYFTIASIKPVTTEINKNIYLTGVIYGIRRTTEKSFYIKNIEIIDCNSSIGKNIVILRDVPESNKFEDYMGFDYSLLEKGLNDLNLLISSDEVYYVFVPIYYEKLCIMNSFPVQFHIEINKDSKEVYFNDFKYYEIKNEIIQEEDVYIYYVND